MRGKAGTWACWKGNTSVAGHNHTDPTLVTRNLMEQIFTRLCKLADLDPITTNKLLEAIHQAPGGEDLLLRLATLYRCADLGMGLANAVTDAAERGDVDYKLADQAQAVRRADWRI
jgi:hypothetical protein